MIGELPTPPAAVPVDDVAPPGTPLAVNSGIAFVPAPELLEGAVPERLKPLVAAFGKVNAAFPAGDVRPVPVESNVGIVSFAYGMTDPAERAMPASTRS